MPFSFMTRENSRTTFPQLPQRSCHITWTNPQSHELIRENLHRAPMYNGQIETSGPRYCPSIEDKVVRFADRESHHVFLEPESLSTREIYCNGISTSLPQDVQERIVHALPGCESARVLRWGYAVEYDMVWPHQIDATAMTKLVPGLFLAGQINGTSGYEEAAGQGLIAGLNAVRFVKGQSPIRLARDEAFIGVMMDDLVTKTPREPYRMFTSRAEYRLQLRADNADERLTPMARSLGLADDARWSSFERRQAARLAVQQALRSTRHEGVRLEDWARRPRVDADALLAVLPTTDALAAALPAHHDQQRDLVASVLANLQYAGYIDRQARDIARLHANDGTALPAWLDFAAVAGLRTEARQALVKFRPTTLGQASRIPGINPADLMVLAVAIER